MYLVNGGIVMNGKIVMNEKDSLNCTVMEGENNIELKSGSYLTNQFDTYILYILA